MMFYAKFPIFFSVMNILMIIAVLCVEKTDRYMYILNGYWLALTCIIFCHYTFRNSNMHICTYLAKYQKSSVTQLLKKNLITVQQCSDFVFRSEKTFVIFSNNIKSTFIVLRNEQASENCLHKLLKLLWQSMELAGVSSYFVVFFVVVIGKYETACIFFTFLTNLTVTAND